MNRKAQAQSIIVFFFLMVALFIAGIIILRLVNNVLTPFAVNLNNSAPAVSSTITALQTKTGTFWDYALVLFFVFNVLLLFISAFMVDIHPAFIILYILSVFFLVIFGNSMLTVLDQIWLMMGTDLETAQTPMTQFIINNFTIVNLGIIVLSGIIMYSKFKLFSGRGAGGSY